MQAVGRQPQRTWGATGSAGEKPGGQWALGQGPVDSADSDAGSEEGGPGVWAGAAQAGTG